MYHAIQIVNALHKKLYKFRRVVMSLRTNHKWLESEQRYILPHAQYTLMLVTKIEWIWLNFVEYLDGGLTTNFTATV